MTTLLTRDFGKIHALAKGARRPKGPFESALDLLCLCRVVFLRKSSGALDLLTEAKLERRFRAASRDLPRLYAGYYVGELLGALTDDGDPHPELFDLAQETLELLAISTVAVSALILRFELGALRWLGHLPSFEQCVECSADVPSEGRVAFGLHAGGVLCANCRPGKTAVISLSSEARKLLMRYSAANLDASTLTAPPQVVYGEVRGAWNQYLSHLLGHAPKMHVFLGTLVH